MSTSWLGQYELGKTIGQGSYSKVKLARDSLSGETVAIKIHKRDDPSAQKHSDLKKNIENELNMILELDSHPNIIQLKGYYEKGTVKKSNSKSYDVQYILIEEYASGGELFFYIKNSGGFSEACARYLFRQIIDGLEHIHLHGIAHRDIKADNLLLDCDYNVKISDFGFAAKSHGKSTTGSYMKTLCGSKPYQAPEIFNNRKYKGSEVDLFATGVTLFILVSGTHPFTAAEKTEYYYRYIYNKQYEKFWEMYQKGQSNIKYFSEEFKDLINQMVAYNPSERLTIREIKNHPWYCGSVPTYSELRSEFETRKQLNDLEYQKQELQKLKAKRAEQQKLMNNESLQFSSAFKRRYTTGGQYDQQSTPKQTQIKSSKCQFKQQKTYQSIIDSMKAMKIK